MQNKYIIIAVRLWRTGSLTNFSERRRSYGK